VSLDLKNELFKKNEHLKDLGKCLSHNNAASDSVVLEGTR
jgi:hypothetical protein